MLEVNQLFLSDRREHAVIALRPTDQKIKGESWPHTLWPVTPLTQKQKHCLFNQQAGNIP